MKVSSVMATVTLAAASVILAACSSWPAPSSQSETVSPSAAPSGSTSPSSEFTPAPPRTSTTDTDRLRLAVTKFEESTQKAGGAQFVITSGDSEKGDTITIAPGGNEKREWVGDGDEPATIVSIVGDGVYTSKTGLDATGVDLMSAVAPDAEWMFESYNAANYVPLSPGRVVDAILAYSSDITCKETDGNTECNITATGISSVPGLGTFESPEDGLKAVVTLDGKGMFTKVVLFPDTKEYNVVLDAIEFTSADISAPSGTTVKYEDLVAEQQKREAEASPAAE